MSWTREMIGSLAQHGHAVFITAGFRFHSSVNF